jgi:hypothetical protein
MAGREAIHGLGEGGLRSVRVLFFVLFIFAAHRDGSPYHRLDVSNLWESKVGGWADKDRDEDGDEDLR